MVSPVKARDLVFIWIVLLSLKSFSVSTESCDGQTSADEIVDTCSKGGDANQNAFLDTGNRVETGLDFIPDDFQLEEFDRKIFSGSADPDVIALRSNFTEVELSERFTRILKGLPIDDTNESPLLSGTDMTKKPAWSFNPYLLKKLVQAEFEIYEIFKDFKEVAAVDARIPVLESYLKDFEESSLKAKRRLEASNDPSEDHFLYIASHPILIYRLIRRFAEDLQPILKLMVESDEDMLDLLYEKANPELLVYPNEGDWDDALESIMRMQRGNNLSTYEVAEGILEKIHTGIQLNALHCLEIGAYYLGKKYHDYAIQWFHVALEKAKKSEVLKLHPDVEGVFVNALDMAIDEHNKVHAEKLSDKWEPGIFTSIVSKPFVPAAYTRQFSSLKPDATAERNNIVWNWALQYNFRRVCSGENIQTEQEKSVLRCWYHQREHPYWYINPLKIELLHSNPPVVQTYEFLGDEFLERLKGAAVNELKRSMVVDRGSALGTKVDSTRTSSQTWLYDDQESDKFLVPLTKKLEILTGLVILPPSSSDAYQVAAYGPSHHYEAHIDSFEPGPRCDEKGNRIITIMGYLSHVKAGGRTGFPVLGIAAEPIKGSLVIWYNLKRNGNLRDERSWHGGCPVVLGNKWITNKWVYYKDNIFSFPCGLDSAE